MYYLFISSQRQQFPNMDVFAFDIITKIENINEHEKYVIKVS
jgi:hypothetical protein